MTEPRIEVDLGAIRANVRAIRDATGRPVMAVVKANAYGHGAVAVARAALEGGAERLGVVDLTEALALRDAGIAAPIVAWLHSPSTDWITAIEADIELGVSSIEQFEMLATAAPHADRPARVHIKVDTGLGRNGAIECDWGALFTHMRELEQAGHGVFAGLFSHLSGTSRPADLAQIEAFERALAAAERRGVTPRTRHLAASAGALDLDDARFDLVRIGIAMYGLTPYAPTEAPAIPLRPALRLLAPVVRHAGAWRIELGTVDGLPPLDAGAIARLRAVDDRGRAWRLGAIGEVATPVEPIDAEAGPDAPGSADAPGDAATWLTIIGGGASSADEWAEVAGTIGYEIVTRLAERLQRRVVDADATPGADATPATPASPASEHAARDRPRDRTGETRDANGALAPRRVLEIDVARLREGMTAQRERGTRVFDVSADAYGLGIELATRLAREAGLEPVVRTEADAARARAANDLDVRVAVDVGDDARAAYGFEPGGGVVRLVTELVHVKRVDAGQGVSYGYEWIAAESTTLGLVPIGYGDALTRRCGTSARLRLLTEPGPASDERDDPVLLPVLGRVAMDQVVVDLDDTDVWPGMRVVVFGDAPGDPSLADVATWAGLSPAAFVASLGPRIVRVPSGEAP